MADDHAHEYLPISSRFIRGRNVLYAEADFSPLFVDYYLHLKDNELQLGPEADEFLKTGLALFSLHCISHPRNEYLAWTINFQKPLMNLFFAGDTSNGDVVGRAYTENVKKADDNSFYQDLVRRGRDPHRSVVSFDDGDMFKAVETFYHYSEQRPARFFRLDADRFAILAAHPDYDEDWFAKVTTEDVARLEETEEVVELEKRAVRWRCGCNQDRILKALESVYRQSPEELFQNEELIEVSCPRCASKHRISREMMEAWVADHSE